MSLSYLLRRLATLLVDSETAGQKGMQLLKENLTPEQREQYEEARSFGVIGSESGRRYRIRHGSAINIDELTDTGQVACRWCIVPQGQLVVGDVLLAQKIALETFERETLAVARRY